MQGCLKRQTLARRAGQSSTARSHSFAEARKGAEAPKSVEARPSSPRGTAAYRDVDTCKPLNGQRSARGASKVEWGVIARSRALSPRTSRPSALASEELSRALPSGRERSSTAPVSLFSRSSLARSLSSCADAPAHPS
eukprot:324484-Pleurochrysis_carterae.AAC.1